MTTRDEMKEIMHEIYAERDEKEFKIKELKLGIDILQMRANMLRTSKKLLEASDIDEDINKMNFKIKQLERELAQGFIETEPDEPKHKN